MLKHEKRILASIIDISIVAIFALLANILLPVSIFNTDMIFLLLYFIIGFIYMMLSLIIFKDRTIGLSIMSLRLVSDDWDRVNLKIIILRSLSHSVLAFYIINILYMILNKSERTLFDEISNSVIVSTGEAYLSEENKNF